MVYLSICFSVTSISSDIMYVHWCLRVKSPLAGAQCTRHYVVIFCILHSRNLHLVPSHPMSSHVVPCRPMPSHPIPSRPPRPGRPSPFAPCVWPHLVAPSFAVLEDDPVGSVAGKSWTPSRPWMCSSRSYSVFYFFCLFVSPTRSRRSSRWIPREGRGERSTAVVGVL